ncbi:hypothetical protein [Desulfobacterium sp. N47]|uniref:Uncharacterized protein n=1 Tax=uncultured Desulfobacterium sp. TaxID=201089 RepID=E1YE69_9BACT|nr:unknown protein [uncultured Desulfobacterium sp.]
MKISKKTAAIISATIVEYISTEEKMLSAQPGRQPLAGAGALPPANLWGISGRQDIMQMRNLMQFRTFNKIRP